MNRNHYRVIGFVLVTITGLIGVAALLHIVMSLPFQGKGPEWIGAIGTVATLVGTIYLATSEARRRDKEDLVRARLHGASMYLRLVHAQSEIDRILTILDETAKVDHGPTFLATCRAKLDTVRFWSIEELIPLAPLPENTAMKLAQAADQLHAFRTILDQKIATGNINVSDYRKEMAELLHKNLSGTRQFINQSIAVCRAGAVGTHLAMEERDPV